MGITHLQLSELMDHKESTLLRLVDERIEIISQENSYIRKLIEREIKLNDADRNKHSAILFTCANLLTIKSYITDDKEKYKKLLGKDVYEIIYFIFFDYVANLIIDFSETKTVVRKRYIPSSKTDVKEQILNSIRVYHFRIKDNFELSDNNAIEYLNKGLEFALLLRLNFLFLFYDEPLIDEFLEGEYFFESKNCKEWR